MCQILAYWAQFEFESYLRLNNPYWLLVRFKKSTLFRLTYETTRDESLQLFFSAEPR